MKNTKRSRIPICPIDEVRFEQNGCAPGDGTGSFSAYDGTSPVKRSGGGACPVSSIGKSLALERLSCFPLDKSARIMVI
jgi:hypothetical protein